MDEDDIKEALKEVYALATNLTVAIDRGLQSQKVSTVAWDACYDGEDLMLALSLLQSRIRNMGSRTAGL
jgi:hypothetical protein